MQPITIIFKNLRKKENIGYNFKNLKFKKNLTSKEDNWTLLTYLIRIKTMMWK